MRPPGWVAELAAPAGFGYRNGRRPRVKALRRELLRAFGKLHALDFYEPCPTVLHAGCIGGYRREVEG